MIEIAPWENPDLPAPFATVEREIEGRTRHFALWHWDERIVWRDLRFAQLWWATLEYAETLDDWERAIEDWRFGRAFSETCYFSDRGEIVGFHRSVSFASYYRFPNEFCILVNAEGSGIARWNKDGVWRSFDFNSYKRLQRQRRRIQARHKFQAPLPVPIWKSQFQPPNLRNALLEGFSPILIQPLSPELHHLLQHGERAELFQAVKDLVTWRLRFVTIQRHQIHDFINEINRDYPALISKLGEHFGLQVDLHFALTTSRIPELKTLLCWILVENTVWSIHSRLDESFTAHELLELQLRLRDALRPILTPLEIEEILKPLTP